MSSIRPSAVSMIAQGHRSCRQEMLRAHEVVRPSGEKDSDHDVEVRKDDGIAFGPPRSGFVHCTKRRTGSDVSLTGENGLG